MRERGKPGIPYEYIIFIAKSHGANSDNCTAIKGEVADVYAMAWILDSYILGEISGPGFVGLM